MQDGGNTVLWAALISGGVALLGALGSQGLAAWVSIRSKKLGLAYKNKAQAYAELLAVVGEFALDPNAGSVEHAAYPFAPGLARRHRHAVPWHVCALRTNRVAVEHDTALRAPSQATPHPSRSGW
jgi:hypothetical protein